MNTQLFHDLAASEEASGYPANARALRAVPDVVTLIEQIARMNYDGEGLDAVAGDKTETGQVFEMEPSDAVCTLSTMIHAARAALEAMDATTTEKG